MAIFGKSKSTGVDSTPVRPWGGDRAYQDVVGESNYFGAIQALYPPGGIGEIAVDVSVVHDPRNKFDSNAVEVRASTGVVGFIPREDAAVFAPILAQLQANNMYIVTGARVYGWVDEDWDSGKPIFKGSVSISLPQPHLMFPINGEPERPYVLLPSGGAIQISGEEKHLVDLKPYLRKIGEAWVFATVHATVDESTKTPKTVVEVHIDGKLVGTLSKASGEHLLPVISYLKDRGSQATVRAMVRGNELKCDVVLYVKKAGELDMDWLATQAANPTYEVPVSLAPSEHVVGPSTHKQESEQVKEAALPPANWYPDPRGLKRLRYWDGTTWTEHVAD